MSTERFVAIDVDEVKAETLRAFLFIIDGAEHWIPKSAMEMEDQVSVGEKDVAVDIAAWIAKDRGLI